MSGKNVALIFAEVKALRATSGELKGEHSAIQTVLHEMSKEMVEARREVANVTKEVGHLWGLTERFTNLDRELESMGTALTECTGVMGTNFNTYQSMVDNIRNGIYECLDRIAVLTPPGRGQPSMEAPTIRIEPAASGARPLSLQQAIPQAGHPQSPQITVVGPGENFIRALLNPTHHG